VTPGGIWPAAELFVGAGGFSSVALLLPHPHNAIDASAIIVRNKVLAFIVFIGLINNGSLAAFLLANLVPLKNKADSLLL
jgi:hypothetical protein